MCSSVRIERIEDEPNIKTLSKPMADFREDNPGKNRSKFGTLNDAFELEQQLKEEMGEEQQAENQTENQADLSQRCSADDCIESTRQPELSVVTQTGNVTPPPFTEERQPPVSLLLTRSQPNKYFGKPKSLNGCCPETKLKVGSGL